MRILLQDPTRKFLLLGPPLFLALTYIGFATTEFLAARFAENPNLMSLQRAIKLAPENAEYQYRIGRYFSLIELSPALAVKFYRSAVSLDSHQARYWFALATAYQILGETANHKNALERAIESDPKTPDVAWQAANLYLVQGDTHKAMSEFRVILENDPSLVLAALQLCWRAEPDVDALLQNVLPPSASVYSSFLDFLISRGQPSAAAKVWTQIVQLHQPIESQHVFDYIRYLIAERDSAGARQVWQQAATLSDLSSYQPSSQNLVINSDFSLPILNAGFDWLYEKSAGVSFALDPTESHLGPHSLLISFGGRAIEDVGIRQLVPVEPNTRYDFSAYFKSPKLEGAGGPSFAIQDFYSGNTFLVSDALKDSEVWNQVNGTFMTGPDTKILVIGLQRIPPASPIRGNVWIDGVRLAPHQEENRQ